MRRSLLLFLVLLVIAAGCSAPAQARKYPALRYSAIPAEL
jgi:hypothetical protein